MSSGDVILVRRLLIAALVVLLLAVVWALSDLLLLLFAAILVALMLRTIADLVVRLVPVPIGVAVLVAGLVVVGVLGTAVWLFGSQISEQIQLLADSLPKAAQRMTSGTGVRSLVDMMASNGGMSGIGALLSRAFSWSTTLIGAAASILIVVFAAVYLALDPLIYREGFLKLVPGAAHAHVTATLDDSSDALRRWLGAQLVAMAAVGCLVGGGLWLIGVPSALALGLIAALLEFVPYVGPAAAAVPALLIAGTHDWQMLGWTLALYVGVQQIENVLLMPLLASRSVSIPPALAIFGIAAMGVIFGPLGLLLGFPLLVVLDTAVRRLYVLDTLGKPVEILGEPATQSGAQDNVPERDD